MADKNKKKKEEEEETLLERLLREQTEEDDDKIDTVVGDSLPSLPQPQPQQSSGGGGKGGGMFGTLLNIGAKAALGAATGGASTAIGTGIPLFIKEGGQIKSKTKKKKRVVRGVGAAKRGYGKATYSKKMY